MEKALLFPSSTHHTRQSEPPDLATAIACLGIDTCSEQQLLGVALTTFRPPATGATRSAGPMGQHGSLVFAHRLQLVLLPGKRLGAMQ